MRGTARRERSITSVDLRSFGWDRALIAVLRHTTLPWFDGVAPSLSLDATPLSVLGELGPRDRLSLVAQFAAHEALLQFAGVANDGCHPEEWAVIRRRGSDCRLVRISAQRGRSDTPGLPINAIQEFAELLRAPALDVFRQSWTRPEAVYQEVASRLRADAAADLRWMKGAAMGEVASPGAEALREMFAASSGRWLVNETSCFRSLAAAAALGVERVVALGDAASPVHRLSAIAELSSVIGPLANRSETEVVESVVEAAAVDRLVFTRSSVERADSASSKVLEMLAASEAGIWITRSETSDLPSTRYFVVSPSLAARKELQSRIRLMPPQQQGEWVSAWVDSNAYERFLFHGEVPSAGPDQAWQSVREPARSFLAALALFGSRIPLSTAMEFLRELGFSGPIEELIIAGVTTLDPDAIQFETIPAAESAGFHIPLASRPALCAIASRIAEARGDTMIAARLLIQAGDWSNAARLLEMVEWTSVAVIVETLRSVPTQWLTEPLALRLVGALFDLGQYHQAREAARGLTGDARELALAEIERRSGEYRLALSRLDRIGEPTPRSELLRAELLFLESRYAEMAEALDRIHPPPGEEAVQLSYLRALLARECDGADPSLHALPADHYLESRLATYHALSAGQLELAREAAQTSLHRARTVPERVDAALDHLHILFSSGAWKEARVEALEMLGLVEETEGDRAAGGVLFLLAYLAADDGQWAHASQRINRLRAFYRGAEDARRLTEIELLNAHLSFSRGDLTAARRSASAILQEGLTGQIGEAAALILDEIDWIERRPGPMRSTGRSGNVELTDRYRALCVRRGEPCDPIVHPFLRALVTGETCEASNRSEELKLFRNALGTDRRDLAQAIADRLGLQLPAGLENAVERELRILRDVATADFPFSGHPFGELAWRYASRNRLGQWNEIGSLPSMAPTELDALLAAETGDWVRCSDQELLYVEGLSAWSTESRETVGALLRLKADLHRMRRLAAQQEAPVDPAPAAVDGMIGDSPSMREVLATIARVSRREVPVCILGESGTGKELVARAIHRQSSRRSKPFTAVNCAALPENLIESELFGHVRGAFTGAERDRPGLIEASDGGTLFLDEIGEMPLLAQAKLLRFLQEGEFRRVGDSANRTADVRVVSATNRKLDGSIEQGRFREDLYYRVSGVEITLPSLRDRAGDILALASHFLRNEHEKHRSGPAALSPDVEAIFQSYRWPGNVRELQNTIRGAHALAAEASIIDVQHLPARMQGVVLSRAGGGSYQDAVMRYRRELIEKSLEQAGGNQNRAATLLRMSRQALAYQIRELGIMVRRGRDAVTNS
ncbi:MAG: sigma 54-interacting transcriptional regulator [Thermoanaerobaculia bacterium]